MKLTIRLFVLSFSLLALFSLADNGNTTKVSATSGLQLLGCWSPFPNCVGASDVFQDASGKYYECGKCDGKADHCYQVDPNIINNTGYWCS